MSTISGTAKAIRRGNDRFLRELFSPTDPSNIEVIELLKIALKDRDDLDSLLSEYMNKWSLSDQDRREISMMTGWRGFSKSVLKKKTHDYANVATNKNSWVYFHQCLLKEFIQYREEVSTNFYFLTLADESWNTGDKQTVIDQYNIKKKVTRSFETCGLDGVAILEFQGVTNSRHGDAGRLILPNVHAIVWGSNGVDIDMKRVAAKLCKNFKGNFGAPGAVISKINPLGHDLMRTIMYMIKPITSAKALHIRSGDQQKRLNSTIKHYRINQSLRIMEIMSYFKHSNLIFGRGDGSKLRRSALIEMRRHAGENLIEVRTFEKLWARIRRDNKKHDFMPVTVLRGK